MNVMNPDECKAGYYDQQQDLSLARMMIGGAIVGFSIFFWLTVTTFIVGSTIVGVIAVTSEAGKKRGGVITVGGHRTVDDKGLVRSVLSSAYSASVLAVSGAITSVLSQKNVKDALSDIIVLSINRFLEQDGFADRVADISTSVVNPDRRKSAARAVGEDVVPIVTGFVGGVVRGMGMKKSKKGTKMDDDVKKSKQISLTSTIQDKEDEGEWIEETTESAERNETDGSERQP